MNLPLNFEFQPEVEVTKKSAKWYICRCMPTGDGFSDIPACLIFKISDHDLERVAAAYTAIKNLIGEDNPDGWGRIVWRSIVTAIALNSLPPKLEGNNSIQETLEADNTLQNVPDWVQLPDDFDPLTDIHENIIFRTECHGWVVSCNPFSATLSLLDKYSDLIFTSPELAELFFNPDVLLYP
jgi:hypothetical protein